MSVTSQSTLKELVDETTVIKDELVSCRDNLKTNLSNKGVDTTNLNKMGMLVSSIPSLKTVPNIAIPGDDFFILSDENSYDKKNPLIFSDFLVEGGYRVSMDAGGSSDYPLTGTITHKRGNEILLEKSIRNTESYRFVNLKVDISNVKKGDTIIFSCAAGATGGWLYIKNCKIGMEFKI